MYYAMGIDVLSIILCYGMNEPSEDISAFKYTYT